MSKIGKVLYEISEKEARIDRVSRQLGLKKRSKEGQEEFKKRKAKLLKKLSKVKEVKNSKQANDIANDYANSDQLDKEVTKGSMERAKKRTKSSRGGYVSYSNGRRD